MSSLTIDSLESAFRDWESLAPPTPHPDNVLYALPITQQVWLRRPKSKRKRVNKKWDKRHAARYLREVPDFGLGVH